MGPRTKGKGRFLVARRAITSGTAVLVERPLFSGSSSASSSRKVFVEDFARLAEEGKDAPAEAFEGALHPCNELIDSLASVIRTKHQSKFQEDPADKARAVLRLRQLGALCTAMPGDSVPPRELAEEVVGLLRDEFLEVTSADEVYEFLLALCCNRFALSSSSQHDLMFAASMFEHSCAPNVFMGMEKQTLASTRTFRALRDIAEGEALSIDYLLLPDGYLPTQHRASMLAHWGFTCSCPRCTTLPELTRAFVCPSCGAPELCPEQQQAAPKLVCQACGHLAEADYARRCLAAEKQAVRVLDEGFPAEEADGTGSDEPNAPAPDASGALDDSVLSCFHHATFSAAWRVVFSCDEDEDDGADDAQLTGAMDVLARGIARLYGDPHPQLLELYHSLAELKHGNLDVQRRYLEHEDVVLRQFYPDVAQEKDKELRRLMHGPRSVAEEDAALEAAAIKGGLGDMD